MKIVDLQIVQVQKQLEDRKVTIRVSDAAKAHLVKVGFDPVFGARPLKRAIQREVANPPSNRILAGEFGEEDTVQVDLEGDKLTFSKVPVPAGA